MGSIASIDYNLVVGIECKAHNARFHPRDVSVMEI